MMAGGTNRPRLAESVHRVPAEASGAALSILAIQAISLSRASRSITGPTWVDGIARVAEPELARGTGDHVDHLVGDIVLHAEQAQRRAALAGGAERRGDDVVGDLFRQARWRRRSSALMPPVSATSGTIGPSLAASARLMARPTSVEPVKATPAQRGSVNQPRADLAVARNEMQRAGRNAGRVQE